MPRKKVNARQKIEEKRCPKDSLIQNGASFRSFATKSGSESDLVRCRRLDGWGRLKRSVDPVQLKWPLAERSQHFELGSLLDSATSDFGGFACRGPGSGWWECNLANNALSWSGGVYDLFGFERGATVTREDCLTRYAEHSRVILERLRADAIRNRCGFTLDAELTLPDGKERWVRIIGAPDLADGRVVRLHGLKLAL